MRLGNWTMFGHFWMSVQIRLKFDFRVRRDPNGVLKVVFHDNNVKINNL